MQKDQNTLLQFIRNIAQQFENHCLNPMNLLQKKYR